MLYHVLLNGKGYLRMSYLNNVDNKFLNKYKKKIKIEQKPYRYILLLIEWWWLKFHAILLLFTSLLRTIKILCICNDFNLIIFDEISNNNKIVWNLNHH
jgi:hypothetical protein